MTDKDIQTKIDKANELLNKARSYFEQSNYDESERCANAAIAFIEPDAERNDLGEERDKNSQKHACIEILAHANNRLNTISISRLDYALALSQAETALLFSERNGNLTRKAALLFNIGIMYSYLSDNAKALLYYQKALQIFEEVGDKEGTSNALTSIGNEYRQLSAYDRALEYMEKALASGEELGSKDVIGINLGNIGTVHRNLSDYARALEYYGKALALAEELGDKASAAVWIGNIGGIYAKQDFAGYDAAKAEEYLLKGVTILQETDAKQYLYERHEALAELYANEKRWEAAFVHHKRYIEIEKEVKSEEAKKQANLMEQRRQIAEREKEIEIERTRATAEKNILNNILPEEITQRLIKGENPIADHFDGVSILFMDIVDFTKLSTTISAQQLVHLLNAIFSSVDAVMREFGLEKIKTIGDAYMAVAGAPVVQEDHAHRAANAALKLLEVMKDLEVTFPESYGDRSWNESIPEIEIRIGVHCGAAAAGVVGENKFLYDLWGDAVNTASRMESHGEAGRIHVSEEFVKALSLNRPADTFSHWEKEGMRAIPRGEIDIKGKGRMNTYFLEKS